MLFQPTQPGATLPLSSCRPRAIRRCTRIQLRKDAPISRAVELAGYVLLRPSSRRPTPRNMFGFDFTKGATPEALRTTALQVPPLSNMPGHQANGRSTSQSGFPRSLGYEWGLWRSWRRPDRNAHAEPAARAPPPVVMLDHVRGGVGLQLDRTKIVA
jgi:hypothetical protein